MILQQLVWKNEEMEQSTELYYHASTEIWVSEKGLEIPIDGKVCFDTYFNIFLARNWEKYTNVDNIWFHIIIEGKGIVKLKGEHAKTFEVQKFCGRQEIFFKAKIHDSRYFYLQIEVEENSILVKGSIGTNIEAQIVKMALVTCTYNRKKDVIKNICLLKHFNTITEKAILEQIYVVDNASSLKKEEIEGERISLILHRNTGGSGGFTKGLEEAMKRKDLTHIILMDDDVHLEFESFRRTKSFLSYLKSEYLEYFLGGAMLRTDKPYILHAAGEDWADGHIYNPYKGTDVRNVSQVLMISEPVETEQAYAGWWYCCIPRRYIEKKGYPMPFFLHCDDVEYSLRNGKPPIYLNGVAVWHEEFEDKRNSTIEYYDVRNRLITNALYKKHGKLRNAFYILCERFYATVFRYRYRDFFLSVKAVEDFLKGPKWLKEVDAEELHKNLLVYGYQIKDIQKLLEKKEYSSGNKLITIGRYFFLAKGHDVIRMGAPVNAYAGKKELLLIDPKSGKGFEVRKSWRETIQCMWWFIDSIGRLFFCYKKTEKKWVIEYRENLK